MSLCRLWEAKCARCDTLALHAREAEVHSMQWSPDILEVIWDKVRTGMWRARMKERLWTEVHKELLGLFFPFPMDDRENFVEVVHPSGGRVFEFHRIDLVFDTIKEMYYEKPIIFKQDRRNA